MTSLLLPWNLRNSRRAMTFTASYASQIRSACPEDPFDLLRCTVWATPHLGGLAEKAVVREALFSSDRLHSNELTEAVRHFTGRPRYRGGEACPAMRDGARELRIGIEAPA